MNLSDPAVLRRFLSKHGIQAEKSLGQHFLCSDLVVKAIVSRLESAAGILEIGPGPGILTSQLALWDRKLIAIELDPKMIPALAESAPYAEVIRQDALKTDLGQILSSLPEPRGIVGNLPYYITGSLINQIADAHLSFSIAVLMMQSEVANRLTAAAGNADRGSISVFVQSRFDISVIEQVPPSAFLPPPKVRSTVLEFVPRTSGIDDEKEFFDFVRIGFTQPRKTLANNLSAGLRIERAQVVSVLESLELRPDVRPHMITQANWLGLRAKIKLTG